MQALPANATAAEPESPVFGADDESGERADVKSTGTSSLKITPAKSTYTAPTNMTGANISLR